MTVPKRRLIPLDIRLKRWPNLIQLVQKCRACPRMEGRTRVLSEKNGRPGVQVMFIAEAPGRHGADRTAVPVYGDATGINFESLLNGAGWRREDVFITNAVLCNPRDDQDRNDTPTGEELANCSFHLESQVRLVDPVVVATLGTSALAALGLIQPHGVSLRSWVAKPIPWNGRTLFPLYHPSPRALMTRTMAQQHQDFAALARYVRGEDATQA